MTPQEKLKFILKLSGLTQEELAQRLGVTFAALNRWINDKAVPRTGAQAKIDELYLEYSGQKVIPANVLEAKKSLVLKKQEAHPKVLKEILDSPDIKDQFILTLTYNSNRIEGSTLSEDETADIIFRNASIPNKSITEHLEAKNHQAALDYLFAHLTGNKPVDEALILKIHSILMNAIRSDAGQYRQHGVRIMGTYVPTANYQTVPKAMAELHKEIQKAPKDMIAHLVLTHSTFEQIHPFADGNGRIGRLLMHAMALHVNLAPVVVRQEKKKLYTTYLNKSQMQSDSSLLEDFICDALMDGYAIVEREQLP